MDTSKEYIAMCDCPEIRKAWKPMPGDWFRREYTIFGEKIDKQIWKDATEIQILVFRSEYAESFWSVTNEKGDSFFIKNEDLYKKTCLWLPRQDQLQDMIDWREWKRKCQTIQIGANGLYDKFYPAMLVLPPTGCSGGVDWVSHSWAKTFEQLWLAFVMYELHGKKWNGDAWV